MKIAILGAAGRTGRLAVDYALAQGHEIVAVARQPATLGDHAGLTVVEGDVTDPSTVTAAVAGADAVLSALGQTGTGRMVCSTAIRHVLDCGIERIVTVSGAGIDVAGDKKELMDKLLGFLVKTFSRSAFEDKVAEYALIEASAAKWTLVRPPRLLDGASASGIRVSL